MTEELVQSTKNQLGRQKKECINKQGIIDILLEQEEYQKICWEDLSLTDKIFLGAVLQEGISENYDFIKPIGSFINPISPTYEFSSEIFKRLWSIKAIIVHPDTDPENIEIMDYDYGDYRCDGYRVRWSLNTISEELDITALIEFIIDPKDMDESQYYELFLLWRKIALNESIEYFKYCIKKFLGIDYKIGYKTEAVLSGLTNYFSVAQIYGIINKAVMKAVLLRAREEVSRKGAVNTITGYLESIGEKAKIKNRDLKKHNRVKACPESSLSKFFFEKIIKIGSEGFSQVPDISRIQNKLSSTEVTVEVEQ